MSNGESHRWLRVAARNCQRQLASFRAHPDPLDPPGRLRPSVRAVALASRGHAMGGTIPLVNNVVRSAFLWTVGAAGAVVLLVSVGELIRHPVGSPWFVLVALTLVTGWSTLRMRTVQVSFSISDTFTIAAALLFGPAAGTVVVVLDALVISLRIVHFNKSRMWTRVVFNATATALAMWLAAHLFFTITQTGPLANQTGRIREVIGALAIFGAVYFLLNTGFIAVMVAQERRAGIAAVWRDHFSALWLSYFSGASIAGVLVLMNAARLVDVTTITFILPLLLILHVSYRAALDRMQEQVEHFARLASYEAALRSTADAVLVTDRDGTEWPIEQMQARVRNRAGEVIGTIQTFRDVSLRKVSEAEREALLESERRARATADEANRLKDEFLTTLSHELRTPATGILGWVRLLKTGRMDDTQNQKALDALERSARAQAVLLEDLLDMSRIVRGALQLDLRPTDLRDVLRGAAETVQPAILSKNLDFRVDIPSEVPFVHADADRLRQVLWNLLSNAVKFTETGGSIRVAVVPEPGHVRIEVIDNGRGHRLQPSPCHRA